MKVVPKRQWKYPLSLERTYAKQLVAHVQRVISVVKAFVPEMRDTILRYAVKLDADEENTAANAHIAIVVDQIRRACESSESMRSIVQRMFEQVGRYNDREFKACIRGVLGYIPPDFSPQDMKVLKDIWVQHNLDLITSIDDETMNRIRNRMAERIIENVDSASLTKNLISDIEEIAGVSVRRAALIGSDQVGKLNGRISQYNQQHAGIDEYRWSSCRDDRVRPLHRYLDGKIFSWSDPPSEGHPGQPIRCRCVAIPIIDLEKIRVKIRRSSFTAV